MVSRPLLLLALCGVLLSVAPALAEGKSVTVRSGDTLSGIADRHGVAPAALARANRIDDSSLIRVGQVLRLPVVWIKYRIGSGDSLGLIAARRGTTSAALAKKNRIDDPSLIRVGQVIRVPRRNGTPATTPAKTPAASARPAWVRYRVRPGESLGLIAARRGTTSAALAKRNKIADPSLVRVGQPIQVPRAVRPAPMKRPAWIKYRIRPGESLGVIAARRGTTSAVLSKRNKITDPSLIRIGQLILVPRGTPGPQGRRDRSLPPLTGTTHPLLRSRATPRARNAQVRAVINRMSRRYGVDPRLARAIAWQESGFQQEVVSSTGAVGVMQLMPDTGKWLARDVVGRPLNRRKLSDNVEGGVAFLGWLLRRTSRKHAIAGYYQGLRSVSENGLYGETRDYVANVEALMGRV